MQNLRRAARWTWWLLLGLVVLALLDAAAVQMVAAGGLWLLVVAALAVVVLHRLLVAWLPRRNVLAIDLRHGVVEHHPGGLVERMRRPEVAVLRDVVDAFARARHDRRVGAVVLRLAPVGLGLAQAQELASAVRELRESGKEVIAWAPTLGEGSAANGEYLVASACDDIHLQPGGDCGLVGLSLQQPFARELFDRFDILPRLDGREEYKAARYPFTETELPAAARESLQALLASLMEQLCRDVGRNRGLDAGRVRELIDQGPLGDEEAREAGLIDGIAHRDEIEERLEKEVGGKLLDMGEYLRRAGRPHRRGTRVALIYAVGTIARGARRGPSPMGPALDAEAVADAVRAAGDAKRVRAIVLRIDSPGGSATASETLWRAVARARAQGTPVVVSMGNLAASGGYYMAAGADAIFAQEATLTGSIGVVSGKLVTRGAWARAGINWQTLEEGQHAAIWSSHQDFSDSGWQRLQSLLDRIYALFKKRVADGRGMDATRVNDVAKGRVWTGAQAYAQDLIDERGGLHAAIEHARELAKASKVQVVVPPPTKRPLLAAIGGAAARSPIDGLIDPVARELFDQPSGEHWLRLPGWCVPR